VTTYGLDNALHVLLNVMHAPLHLQTNVNIHVHSVYNLEEKFNAKVY
jgi:hypothetical protein